MIFSYDIDPVPAPRMTRSDRWKKRPIVLRYFDFKDNVREQGLHFGNGDGVVFVIPMPKSWSQKKKAIMDGLGCTSKPDVDNLLKALLDALFLDDAHIWKISRLEKVWGYQGKIIIERR